MLTLTPHVKIDVHLPPTDMRKSFDGLTGLVRSVFQAEPRDGSWFLFFNHRRDRVKPGLESTVFGCLKEDQ
jgi:transposase